MLSISSNEFTENLDQTPIILRKMQETYTLSISSDEFTENLDQTPIIWKKTNFYL